MPSEILIFVLDQQRYALPSMLVQELARAVEIISVPGAPATLAGVIEYRGKVVPVLNLRHCLGLTPRTLQATDYLIILRVDKCLYAIRVDRALDVSSIDAARNEEMWACHSGSMVVHVQEGTVIVLNLVPLLKGLDGAIRPIDTDPHHAL